MSSREENISNLGTAVQHNFRRTQLLPSRNESITSLGTAVQHNFRRTQLLPSREESIPKESGHCGTAQLQAHAAGAI